METSTYIIITVAVLLILLILISFSLRKKKYDEEPDTGASGFELAAQEALRQSAQRGKMYYMFLLTTATSIGLAKLWVWWFKPKKVAITGVLLFVGGSILAFLTFTTHHGDIAINIVPYGVIPPENVKGINVVIEAMEILDTATKSFKPLTGIEFERIEENIEPFKDKVTVPTNEDGIAYVKYSGRFDPDDIVFLVRVLPQGTKYESRYVEDSVKVKPSELEDRIKIILLRKKRQMVYGTMPVLASIESLKEKLPPGEKPNDAFTLEVYPTNAEGKNTQVGRMFLKKSAQAADSLELQWNGSRFVLEKQTFKKEPYLLTYLIEDSSKIAPAIKSEDPKFQFQNDPKGQTVSQAGGASLPPIKPVVELKQEADNIQYTFQFLFNKKPFANIDITITAANVQISDLYRFFEANTNSEGIVVYPKDNKIPYIEEFWNSVGSLKLKIDNSKLEGSKKTSLVYVLNRQSKFKDNKMILEFNDRSRKLEQVEGK